MLAPALVFGQALGRWGNFFNYEAYGVATDLPWKMFVPLQHRILGTEGVQYAHPLFLYESLWDLLIFLFLWRAGNFPRKRPGIIFGLYLLFYSMGRFFFEMLRADVTVAFGLRVNMILSLVVFVFGFLVLFRPADKNEINLKIVV
jgi:phosphatidylglycerol---prolipoprotein diacylglyceryl transferase